MHSSFPRKEDVYRPVARDPLRVYAIKLGRMIQSSPRLAAIALLSIGIITWLFWTQTEPAYTHPPVILVAVLDHTDSAGEEIRITDKILQNRWEYADAHGIFQHRDAKCRIWDGCVQFRRLSNVF